MNKPDPKQIAVITEVAGVPVGAEAAMRIGHAIGWAFEGFSVVAGTLPFDLEPATFVVEQKTDRKP